jgi:uncharacterized membrane protein YphA (DoxX/SURF4 family)
MPLKFAKHAPIAPKVLLWYQRFLAAIFFVSGLGHWAFIVGATGERFDEAPVHIQVVTGYFSLIEVIAAVGLWSGGA